MGQKIATLVDDSKMKLTLYFNYAYQDVISKGQPAVVSIPSTMSQLNGTVSEINYVKKITPEGAILFQAVITVDNPGTLTADMGATAVLTSPSNETIYPYEAGKLAYNRATDIVTKAAGKGQCCQSAQLFDGQSRRIAPQARRRGIMKSRSRLLKISSRTPGRSSQKPRKT
jgi:hypothetical protein